MKKIFLRAVVLLLVLSLAISAFASCGETEKQDNDAQSEKEEVNDAEKPSGDEGTSDDKGTSGDEGASDDNTSDDNEIGTEGLAYTLLDDDTYEVSVGSAKEATQIVIPSKYNGKPVTSIASAAFRFCKGLISIDIPNSVTSIAFEAFRDCTGLTSIDIPDSVKSIGDYAFYRCTGLTSIDIPDSVKSIGDDAFAYCSGLTSVTIGNGVESIGMYAFRGCTGLTSIKFRGSEAEWNAIEKGVGWNSDVPASCQIIFNYTGE